MDTKIDIFELQEVKEEYLVSIKQLLSQLSSRPLEFTMEQLHAIVNSESSLLFVAMCNGKICGMLTLATYLAPTGRKWWVEDVVVDESMRGYSIGRRLLNHAMECARLQGGTLMLTSRPSRVAANALYRSAGFELKETNVYKIECPPHPLP